LWDEPQIDVAFMGEPSTMAEVVDVEDGGATMEGTTTSAGGGGGITARAVGSSGVMV
jgi:hypothetical protein